MPRVPLFESGNRGLWLAGPRDKAPVGSLRRAKGIHGVKSHAVRSRWGSELIVGLEAHSLYGFDGARWQGAGGQLYRNGIIVKAGLSGNRLTFARMPPSAGQSDFLYVAGGGELFKVSGAGVAHAWGIVAPPDGFTAVKSGPLTKSIDVMDVAAGWTAVNCVLADEATIKQQGTNSMKMTVAASTIGQATKAIAVDLSAFAGPVTSPDEDFISVWVRVDNPKNLEYMQMLFDVGAANFATDFYTRTILTTDDVPPATQLVKQTVGIGDIPAVHQDNTIITSSLLFDIQPTAPFQTTDAPLEQIAQTTIVVAQSTWVRLRMPKLLFSRSGNGAGTWASVAAVRLIVKTNAGAGGVIVYWDDLKLIGGTGMQGSYKYHITYLDATRGVRSNPNVTPVEVADVERENVAIAGLPTSPNTSVTNVEIWRTVGNGSLFFKAGQVPNGTAVFTDNVADYFGLNSVAGAPVLASTELPLDNAPPDGFFEDVVGPHVGRLWWTRIAASGKRGRLYYSPIGRPDAVAGFLQLTEDDDAAQKAVLWNGALYVCTEGKWFQIIGEDEPFTAKEVVGAAGSSRPFTVIPTPYGVPYQAVDGVRLFNGTTSDLVAFEGIGVLFRGESAESIPAFEGDHADYGNNEYMISDNVTTLALNLRDGTWRNVGVGTRRLFFEFVTSIMVASLFGLSKVVFLEKENIINDDGQSIPFEMETPGYLADKGQKALIDRLFIEINTENQAIVPRLILDNQEIVLPTIVTGPERTLIEYALCRTGRLVGVRLTGSLLDIIEVYNISADIFVPELSNPLAAIGTKP